MVSLNVVLSHVPRSHNEMADEIANWGVGLHLVVRSIVMPEIP